MVPRIPLGELLVRAGVLDPQQLHAALAVQRKWGGQLGKILVDMGHVEEAVMVRALSKQMGWPRANLETATVSVEVLRVVGARMAQTGRFCPEHFDEARGVLTVAMVDPNDRAQIDELAFRTGFRISVRIAGESEVVRAIERIYFGRRPRELELSEPPDPGIDAEATDARDAEGGPQPEPFRSVLAESGPPESAFPWASGPDLVRPARRLEGLMSRLDAAQERHRRALRVMVDLLIERGVFTEDEFRTRLRPKP